MSVSEMYCKMTEDFVAQCWLRYNTVEDVHNAIDAFMAKLQGE